jgi:hypothetical protein
MVPTEEERLPVRVSVSVRGLSAFHFRGRTLHHSLPHVSFVLTHIRITMVMLHARPKPKRTLSLLFTRQFCSLNFSYYVRHFCTFLGRYWPAMRVFAAQQYDYQYHTVRIDDCGGARVWYGKV